MKKFIKIYLTSFGLLIIPLTLLTSSVVKIFVNDNHKTSYIISDFTYQIENSKEIEGFEHVKLKQFDIYNPETRKYEYFLNDDGKKYLIKRFMQTTIIGPEISSLKSIVIGNDSTAVENLGLYYSIANSIFINTSLFLKNAKYNLWKDKNEKLVQEKRAEAILSTLIHEYFHHLFSSYASSPIGYSENPSLIPKNNVEIIYLKNKNKNIWNKKFYEEFKKLFFANGVVPPFFEKIDLPNYKKYIENIKLKVTPKSWKNYFQKIMDLLEKYTTGKSLYNQFNDVKDIFELVNKNKMHSISKALEKDNDEFYIGIKINNIPKIPFDFPEIPFIYIINYKSLFYYYSMSEQVVRKLLLSIFIKPFDAKFPNKFKNIHSIYLDDYLYTSNYINYAKNNKKNYWHRFYSDNIFPSYYEEGGVNRSKKLIENIIDPLIGHDNHSHLSFITSKNSWNIASNKYAYAENLKDIYDNHKKNKIGGYIDSKDYNNVGYRDDEGNAIKFPIKTKKFIIWYKNKLEEKLKDINVNIKSWHGANNEYYWYTKNFINIDNLIDKKLFFFQVDDENKIIKEQAFESIRKNDFGIANSFNNGLAQDKSFIKNVMDKSNSKNEYKWLVVANISDGDVKLKYYDKQEDIVEKIWN